jgi:hypothetical protein
MIINKDLEINEDYINTKFNFFHTNFNITGTDVFLECLFSIIDPEAPETSKVMEKFVENRKINLNTLKKQRAFKAEWSELTNSILDFLESIKTNDEIFTKNCNLISNLISKISIEYDKEKALTEMIYGSMDLIVFVFNRYHELQEMICQLFKYDAELKDFVKIFEDTCIQFSIDCRKKNFEDNNDIKRITSFFSQAILLSGIGLISKQSRNFVQ